MMSTQPSFMIAHLHDRVYGLSQLLHTLPNSATEPEGFSPKGRLPRGPLVRAFCARHPTMQSTQGPDATENGLSTSRRRIARDGAPTPTPVPTAASPPDQPTLINARPSGENKRPLDTDDADDSSDRPGEQRRATNIACDYCRTNHLKCNGAKTCSQCKKRELSCVYPQPKKRGPKPGVSSKLKQQQQVCFSSLSILTHKGLLSHSCLPDHRLFAGGDREAEEPRARVAHEVSYVLPCTSEPRRLCCTGTDRRHLHDDERRWIPFFLPQI